MMLIGLHKGKGLISKAIQWQTRSPYSHASIWLEGWCYEAVEFEGVVKRSEVARRNDLIEAEEEVDFFIVHGGTNEHDIKPFLDAQVNKDYDYGSVLRFISRKQADRRDSGKWFCSELVFAAIQKGGVDLLWRIEPWAVSPGLLALSPLIGLVHVAWNEGRKKKASA